MRTVIRTVALTAMLVDCSPPSSNVAERVEAGFRVANVRVVRVDHATAAYESLAVAMPQVVIVLGSLRADERNELADRATAVGALLMHVDPDLDPDALDDLVDRAAQAALERKLARDDDEKEPGPPSSAEDDIDSHW